MTQPVRRPDLAGLPTYSSVDPGGTPVRVRASSNETAGPAHPEQVEAGRTALRESGRYPRLGGADLVDRLAATTGLPSARIAVGDGSLSLLDRILLTFVRPGDEVVTAWRSYEAYPLSIRISHGRPTTVPLDYEGRHDLAAMWSAIGPSTRVVIVCNPNNPTGTVQSWPRLLEFIDSVPPHVLVVLDEAYAEFAGARGPGADLRTLTERRSLLVLRTFSKAHGLAGLRVGWVTGHERLIAAVRTVLPPFPVSTPAVAAACWSLDHPEHVARRVAEVVAERDLLTAELDRHGLPWLASAANFVWLPLGDRTERFTAACRDHGVLVRPFDDEGVRVTVGHPELREALAPVLADWSPQAATGRPR